MFKKNINIAMALTFVMLVALAGLPLAARGRRGATVTVTLADGKRVTGELLAVKVDALLVYDRNARQGMSIALGKVAQVKLFKKSKFLTGLGIGLIFGLGFCVYNLEILGNDEDLARLSYIVLPPVTGLGGGILGALTGIPEKFALSGSSSQDVRQNLKRLRRFAREKDSEKTAAFESADGISSNPDVQSRASQRQRHLGHRFRLLWSPGYQDISGKSGFDSEHGTFRFVNGDPSKDTAVYPFEPVSEPYISSGLRTGQLRLGYELTPHFSPSIEFVSSGRLNGYAYLDFDYYSTDYARRYLSNSFQINDYYYHSLLLGLNWTPILPSFARKHIVELGIAAGPALAHCQYSQNSNSPQRFKTWTWSCKAHAAFDYFYTESFSLGLFFSCQYLRASFPSAAFFNEKQQFWPEDDYHVDRFTRPTEFVTPGRNIQLGGTAYGLRVGLRF